MSMENVPSQSLPISTQAPEFRGKSASPSPRKKTHSVYFRVVFEESGLQRIPVQALPSI